MSRLLPQVAVLVSADAAKLLDFVVFAHNLWAAPLMLIGVTYLLYCQLGLLSASAGRRPNNSKFDYFLPIFAKECCLLLRRKVNYHASLDRKQVS
jgi:hypothetical protein